MVLGVQEPRTTFRTPTCPKEPYEYRSGSLSNPCDSFHFWSRHVGEPFRSWTVRAILGYSSRSVLLPSPLDPGRKPQPFLDAYLHASADYRPPPLRPTVKLGVVVARRARSSTTC
jgi:hypothetical protein